MKIYLAGPLFNAGERGFLADIATRLRALDFDVFVPHEQFVEQEGLDARRVYATDLDGIRSADAVLAWLDGSQVDDGTAVEIGFNAQYLTDFLRAVPDGIRPCETNETSGIRIRSLRSSCGASAP